MSAIMSQNGRNKAKMLHNTAEKFDWEDCSICQSLEIGIHKYLSSINVQWIPNR